MGWLRRVLVWMAWCAAFVGSINLFLVSRAPNPYHHAEPRTPSPSTTLQYRTGSTQRVYLRGEVYSLRESNYHERKKYNRKGLSMLSDMYIHLPAIKALYASPMPLVQNLVDNLLANVFKRRVTDDPWDVARSWATPHSLVPDNARGLGDVLAALSSAPIVAADVGYKGTQLKVTLLLKGGQRAIFKPQWYRRSELIEGEVYAGADRHNGEITAFHLSRLLGYNMVPLAVGRKVSLKHHILPVASKKLSSTFFTRRGGRTCFYGVCYYCHKDSSVCDDGHYLEGSVIYWLPSKIPLLHLPHPWARSYKKNKNSKWEEDPNYCQKVINNPFFSDESSPRLLDLMDTAVFDFLIQNGDRHHYTVVAGEPDSSVVLLDNGKSFGDAYVDHMDVLAPILQCCSLRQSTYERLILLSGGGLSSAMRQLTSLDPIAPLLTAAHREALDRRLHHILAALAFCKERKGGWHNVLF